MTLKPRERPTKPVLHAVSIRPAFWLERPDRLEFENETLGMLAERMTAAIRRVEARYDAGDVVVVGHQDPIQAARLALTGRSLSGLHSVKPTHASVITLAPGPSWRELTFWEPS